MVGGGGGVSRELIIGAMSSPEIAGLMDQYWAARLEAISVIVDRAIRRGEIPAGTDPAALMHAMAAPLFYQLLVACAPVTERDADLAAAATLTATRAGLFAQ